MRLTLIATIVGLIVVQGLSSAIAATDESNASAISAGSSHSCAVVDGAAMCWGSNFSGKLGDGTQIDSNIPVQVLDLESDVTAVSAAGNYSCAVVDGAAMCWGSNGQGQLGNGTRNASLIPVQVRRFDGGCNRDIKGGASYLCRCQRRGDVLG